jgi:nicotinamide-nucleotide amidase
MTATLQQLAKAVGESLRNQHLLLATAESCTGGGLSFWITSIPDSSQWFDRGFVTYSNAAKIELLGVNPVTLDTFGAVSEPTVREMAEKALVNSDADVSIAITGIAGPSGGTPDKPVGTVWIAWARLNAPTQTFVDVFIGNRAEIREKVIEKALYTLLDLLNATAPSPPNH